MEKAITTTGMAGVMLIIAVIAFISAAVAGDAAATGHRLHQSVVELEALRAQARSEEAGRQRQRAFMEGRISQLAGDKAGMRSEIQELRQEMAALESRHTAYQATMNELEQALVLARDAAGIVAKNMMRRIANGISREREERLQAVETALVKLANDDPLQQGEGLSRLIELAFRELQLATQRELNNETIFISDSQRIHAYIYRLGLLTEGFVDEQGLQAGLFDGAGGGWHLADSQELKQAILKVVAMMRQTRPPDWLTVPVMEKGSSTK